MKRSFLSKLHINGIYYLVGALLLLVGLPLYQFLVLFPQGYGDALAATGQTSFTPYLLWIEDHMGQFLSFRALLVIAFATLIGLPFTLFRIIVAQEILGREEEVNEEKEMEIQEKSEQEEQGTSRGKSEEPQEETEESKEPPEESTDETDGMPANAWRGKGFAVVAAWSGLLGIILYTVGTLVSTVYLSTISNSFTTHAAVPDNFSTILGIMTLVANTIGVGLLALSCLFFGAMIARSGHNLWPGVWVVFGYTALAVAALLSASAVAVASTSIEGQSPLTTPAILIFALWVLWFSIMLVRLKPEP